jgi:hypothetical protein
MAEIGENDHFEIAKFSGALSVIDYPRMIRLPEGRVVCRLRGKVPSNLDDNSFAGCTYKARQVARNREIFPGWENLQGQSSRFSSFSCLPQDIKVRSRFPETSSTTAQLSCSKNLLRRAAALVQLGFAGYTLYGT